MFTKYYSEHNGLDESRWTEYTFCVIWLSLNWFLDALDWITILIDLFYVDRQENSKSRRHIVQHHLSRQNALFIVDAVSSLPFELMFVNNVELLLCIRLIKTLKILALLSDFDSLMTHQYSWGIYKHPISKLIFYFIVLFLHLIIIYGSIWFLISTDTDDTMHRFLERDEKLRATARAFYYIMVTMFAVGYGDITPLNMTQVGFIVVVQITGFFVLTGIIGSLVPWFFQSMIEEFEFTHRRDLILRYLSKNGNDGEIRDQIMTYFSSLWSKCRGLDDNLIYSKYLPLHLRREVGAELVGSILSEEKFFAKAPESFRRCLVDHLSFAFFLEDDIIFNSGIILDKLPILLSGDVEEFTFDDNNKRIMLRSITDGRLFAQNEFISGEPITSNFESKTNGLQICFIHRRHWTDLLQQNPSVAAQIFEESNKRNHARGILKSQQSKKLMSFTNNDDDQNKQKSIEGMYLPHSTFAQQWNFGNFIGLFIYIFVNSMILSFSNSRRLDSETWTLLAILWMVDIFFIIDIWFRKKVFAMKRGETVISDPETVSKIYMKRNFYLDLIAIIPFEFILLIVVPHHMVLGRVNRYIRLFRFASTFKKTLDFLHCTGSKRNIVIVFSMLFIMLHLMACLWYLVGDISHQMDNFEQRNWIDKDPAISVHSDTGFRWIRSLYFAFLTSFTVGYGGITPDANNFGEQIMCMVLIIIGCASYFGMMGLITVWAEQANKVALNFERNFEIVKHCLSELNVEENVNNDVRSFMSQLWSNQYGYKDETVLNLLPRNIRVSIMENLSLGVLSNIGLFANVPKGFMEELLLSFTIKSFCPNELLFQGKVVSDFFIVYQGSCMLKARVKDSGDLGQNGGARADVGNAADKIMMQPLEQRDYFGLEALDLFNQVKEARQQKAKRQQAANENQLSPEESQRGSISSSESILKRETAAESLERERKQKEIKSRKMRAMKHRLSYYTSYEFEDQALRNCPFTEFAIRADSSGFVTIMAMNNDDFESLLQRFPDVKTDILSASHVSNDDAPNVGMQSSFSVRNSLTVSKSGSSPQNGPIVKSSSIVSGNLLHQLSDVEINFEDTEQHDAQDDEDDVDSSISVSFSQQFQKQCNRNRADLGLSTVASSMKKQNTMNDAKKSTQMPDSQKFYELFGLIHPLSDVKLWWNIISLLLCLYNVLIVPLRIAFMEHASVSSNATFILIDVILDVFFCIDVYMRFDRFTFIEEGFVEPNKSVIRARYIGYKLVLDLLSSFPWDFIVIASIIQPASWTELWSASNIHIYYWLRLVRLLRVHNLGAHQEEIDAFIEDRRIRIKPTVLRISIQIIGLLVVTHWGACIFYFVGKETTNEHHNWLKSEDPPVAAVLLYPGGEYLLSLYWSLITMSSVGFGDIKPQTVPESCCGLIIMMIGVMVYASTTAIIASFAAHANPPGEAFREKSQPIQKYLKTLKVSSKLKERSDSYFDELWKRFKGVPPLTAISCVSDSLQVRILESILYEKLVKLPLFRDAPKMLVKTCAQNMKHELYIQDEKIVNDKARNLKMFLLLEGVARGTNGSRSAKVFVAGTTFSKEALTDSKWTEPGTIVATENCHCFTLRRDEFQNIVSAKAEWRNHVIGATVDESQKAVSKKKLKSNKMMAMMDQDAKEERAGSSNNDDLSNLKLALFAVLIFNLWMNPFQCAFLVSNQPETVMITLLLCWCTDILFAADWIRILLFVKSKNAEGNNIESFKDNVKAYFNGNRVDFILHCLALFPFDLILVFALPNGPRLGTILRFVFKTYHLGALSELLNVFIRKIRANPVQKLLITMLLLIYLGLHSLSCIFSFFADDDMFGALTPNTPMERYLCCVYYVITVVTTTGYGDITPKKVEQIVFTIALIFAGNMIYSATIGTVSSWVGSTYSRILEHFNQLKELEAFCKNKKLNPELSSKILFHHNQSFNQRSREQILRLFPTRLQKQCSYEIYGGYIRSFEYFQFLSEAQCWNIVRNIRTQTYLKGDVVLSRGDLNDQLHIVLSGKGYLVKYKESEVNSVMAVPSRRSSLHSGAWFGDFSFFTSHPCAVSVIAASDILETMHVARDVLLRIVEFARATNKESMQKIAKEEDQDENERKMEQFDIVEADENGNEEDIMLQLLEEEAANKRKERNAYNMRKHPFLIFLEKYLSKNPLAPRSLIQNAMQFWKVKVEFVDELIKCARERAKVEESELTPEATPDLIDAEAMAAAVQQQNKESEEQMRDDTEVSVASKSDVVERVDTMNWIENQVTLYDERIYDDAETRKLREIQARFANHDKHNAANCVVM